MSLAAEFATRIVAARREETQRRRRQALLLVLILATGLVLPFLRARARSEERADLRRLERDRPGRLDLNEADAESLESLPGIGPVQAERILARRRLLGPFRRADDLSRLPSIGKNRLDRIRDRVRTEER
ncbi:MAG: helix-hairpin-helix domain-containing protein [Planctomycetes bacterium]|nr:helix-hairpin-helix domain-containing protein [Planctomycetota bacterium]